MHTSGLITFSVYSYAPPHSYIVYKMQIFLNVFSYKWTKYILLQKMIAKTSNVVRFG